MAKHPLSPRLLMRLRPATAAIGVAACLAAVTPSVSAAVTPAALATSAAPQPLARAVSPSAAAALAGRQCVAAADFVHVVGQGELCSRAGATVVRLKNGRQLSLAAPDHAATLAAGAQAAASPAVPAVTPTPLLPAQCVDPVAHQHVELYYAHFAGQLDGYAAALADIQQQFRDVDTAYLNYDASYYFGVGAHLYAECDVARNPVVHNITLSTPLSASDFSSIATDMQLQGHTNPHTHYWIWTDGNPAAALGYAGQSSLEDDDSASPLNVINRTYEYSINFGFQGTTGSRIFAHENGHAMGAVQRSAPNSTGAYHCTDGLDVMCYNDGGPQANRYTQSTCARAPNGTTIFDCNFDDYFNPGPAPGSYLATHWNIANVNNGWLLLQPATSSTALSANATTVTPGQPLTLTATVGAPSPRPGTPTGAVSFYDGPTLLATSALDGSGAGRFSTAALAPGVHTLSATFGGAGAYTASTSSGLGVIVLSAGPALAGIHPAVIDTAGHGAAAIAVDDSHVYARPSNGSSFGAATVRSTALFYGSRGTLFANLDGAGQPASAVAINDASIFVMKNVNGNFGAVQRWSTATFYGSRSTVLADVDGSGRASAVAINDNSIWVMLNTGSGFAAPQQWSSSAFYGSRGTVMAVMSSSGRASPVAINDGSIWMMQNNGVGLGFASPTLRSSSPFFGSRGTYLADMDGSGIASPVAINDSSIWVMRNDGTTLSAPTSWSTEPFYGTWMYLADVDGSGRASPIAVGAGGIWVKQNTGGTLGPSTSWLSGAYYGTR